MDPLLVAQCGGELAGWVDGLPPGRERDVSVAELALAELITTRWHGRSIDGRSTWLSCPPEARPDCLVWSHLVRAEHRAPECERLLRRLAARHALDVVSASPHARFGSAYFSHLLGADPSCGRPDSLPIAGWPAAFEVRSSADCDDLTHAIFWLTDFGQGSWPAGVGVLDADRARIEALVGSARLIVTADADVDLALEVALADILLRQRVHPYTAQLLRHPRVEALAVPPARAPTGSQVRAAAHPRIVLRLLQGAIERFVPSHRPAA